MKPALPFKVSALVLAVSTVLGACSSGGSDSDDGPQNDPIDQDISTDAFTVCHDANLDGQCSTTEPGVVGFTSIEDALAATVASGDGPTIVVGSDNTLYTAASDATSADAWSTLLYNEAFYNPKAADADSAAAYLKEKLSLTTANELDDSEAVALRESVKAALQNFPTENRYAVIAAVVDAAVAQGSLVDAVPTADAVASQKVLPRTYNSEITPLVKATWEISDGDERLRMIVPSGDNLLVVNRWHNQVVIIPAAGNDQVVTTKSFAAIETAGHHTYSTEQDFVTGASEHPFSDTWLSDAGDVLYALVAGPSETDSPDDDSYGLFRVPLVGGEIPEYTVTVRGTDYNVPHRNPSVTRVASKTLTQAIQLSSGAVLAYDEDAGYVRVYDEALVEDTDKAFAVDRPLIEWSLANNGESLIALFGGLESGDGAILTKYDASTLAETGVVALSADAGALLGAPGSDRAMVLDGNVAHLINTDLMSTMHSISLTGEPSSSSRLSEDGQKAALVFGGSINIVNLSEASPVVEGAISYSSTLRALAFASANEIVYSTSPGELQSVMLTGLESTAISIDDVLVDALAAVNEDTLNHGSDLNAVIFPLNMPASYGLADYTWTSTAPVVADGSEHQGDISQPAIGSPNVVGSVTVQPTYSFRGESSDGETATFDVEIRAMSEERTHTTTVMTGDLAEGSFSLMAANMDGSQLYAWAKGEEINNLGLVTFDVAADGKVTAGTPVALAAEYADSTVRGLVSADTKVYVIVDQAFAEGSATGSGKAHVLSYDIATESWVGDLELAGYVRNKGVSVSQDGTTLSISVDTSEDDAETGTHQVTTYAVADLSPITTIETDQDSTGTRYPVLAVSNDGQLVAGYTRNSARQLHLYTADNVADSEGLYAKAAYDISSTTFGVAYDDATDLFVAGDHVAKLTLFSSASQGQWSDPVVFETARGAWNGVETVSRAGRMYEVKIANNTAYLFNRMLGVSAVDLSSPTAPVEKFWAPLPGLVRYAGTISGDGSRVFNYAYSEDEGGNIIAVLNAQ